jgi:hypothetical protein
MTYADGSTVGVGDLVWWNEGDCVGYVQVVAESKNDYESWGLTVPSIFLSNRHPFDRSLGGVAYAQALFEEEGIGPLSTEDLNRLERATSEARRIATVDFDTSTYAVTTEVKNCQQVGWIFTLFRDGREAQVVKVAVKTD